MWSETRHRNDVNDNTNDHEEAQYVDHETTGKSDLLVNMV